MEPQEFIDLILTTSAQPSKNNLDRIRQAASLIGTMPAGVLYPRAVIAQLQRNARCKGSNAQDWVKSWNYRFARLVAGVWTRAQIELWLSAYGTQSKGKKSTSKKSSSPNWTDGLTRPSIIAQQQD